MHHPRTKTLTLVAAAAAAVAWLPALAPHSAGLIASGDTFAVGLDTDGDGLHDALEVRLGTDPVSSDSDSDGLDDHEEMLVGGNPLVPDALGEINYEPALYLDLYAVGGEVVLQFSAIQSQSVTDVEFVWATEEGPDTASRAGLSAFMPYLAGSSIRSASNSTWSIHSGNMIFPASTFEQFDSMALAVLARVDGESVGYEVQLAHMNNALCQVRDDLINQANGGNGGVFPVEPGGQQPTGTPDEVCVQTLTPTAFLPGGKIEYQVTDASCQTLANAVCLPGCSSSVLDTLIGIDILSLID